MGPRIWSIISVFATVVLAVGLGSSPPEVKAAPFAPDGVLGGFAALGSGVNAQAQTLVLHRGDLYVAGAFTAAGGVAGTSRVAAWSPAGENWRPLGAGVNEFVYSLAAADDTIYAGGQFTGASGVPHTNRVAAWSTIDDTWHALGLGSTNTVEGVAAAGDRVYVGGYLASVSGIPNTDYLAAWSYTDDTWSALGAGLQSGMYSFGLDDDTVYVGGDFNNASGVPGTNKLAAWSYADDTWHALGTGTSHTTYAFAIDDDTVYAGGYFSTASGVTGTDKVAAWSYADDTWHPLGMGLDGTVAAIELDGHRDLLYVAGAFTATNGGAAYGLKRFGAWDRGIGAWIPMTHSAGNGIGANSGISWEVTDLAIDDSRVYIAGPFVNAGGVAAADYVAVWQWDPPEGVNSLSADPGATVTLTGEGFVGVPRAGGVRFGSTVVSYTRDDSATITATVPAGVFSAAAISVDGAGGWGHVGTFTSTAAALPVVPAPPIAPDAPQTVVAQAHDGSATVSWAVPASIGSFPVTTYQVTSDPSGGSCVTLTLSCEVTGLDNGTEYTFTVRALNGAGWGPWSGPSEVVTPSRPVEPALVITGSRGAVRGKAGIVITGTATGLAAGTRLLPWMRFGDQETFRRGAMAILPNETGGFIWQRRGARAITVQIRTHDGQVNSNSVTISGRD